MRALALPACLLAFLVALTGCASTREEHLTPEQVAAKIERLAGRKGSIHELTVYLVAKDESSQRQLKLFVACPPTGACLLVDRHGTTYPDMRSFVDKSDEIPPGYRVLANSDPLHPQQDNPHLGEYTKTEGSSWGWYAGGGALLVVLLAAAWWVRRRRRRARNAGE